MNKAVMVSEPGLMQIKNLKELRPERGEVLIAHTAIGVNFTDIHMRRGDIKAPHYPFIPGVEAVGIIEEIGDGIEGFNVGDRVAYATMLSGAYCERRVISAEKIVSIPPGYDDEVIAAILFKALTAHYLLKRTYNVKPGDNILIQAAAGGVGHILAQWASYIGANVIGIVGSEEKVETAKNSGCHHVLLENEDIVKRVLEITDGKGASVAYDSVGKTSFMNSLNSLGSWGLLVSYGHSSGFVEPFDLTLLKKNSLFITSPDIMKYKENRYEFILSSNEVFYLMDQNILNVNIYNRYSLEDAGLAHEDIESRKTTGSSVILI